MAQIDLLYEHMKDDLELVRPSDEPSEIAKYYAGKILFITGVTGFMGKCLIEKLLRSCPDIKHIYILMREKKNIPMNELLKTYFQHMIFEQLRKINPNFEAKVTPLKGDLIEDNLGLSEADSNLLKDKIEIIFHNGANVKFDMRVNLALKVNVLGTVCMLKLAEECKKLEIFMYISTAYSHPYVKEVKETFYPAPADLNEVYVMIKKDGEFENGMPEKFLKTWLGKFPNIYTFTKAISEDLVRQHNEKANFVCAVYRPSIVISASKEPLAGWCGNRNGPVNIFIGTGMGIIHTAPYNRASIDFAPSDYTINALIAVTWDAYVRRKIERKPLVYNYGSTSINPTNLAKMKNFLFNNFSLTDTSQKCIWRPFLIFSSNNILFWIMHIAFHFIPACILDLVLIIMGKKPRAVSLFWFASKHMDSVRYFGNGNWKIMIKETLKVIDRFNPKDKEIFYCDMRPESFDWQDYLIVLWRGVRIYIMKEKLDPKASYRRYIQNFIMHYGLILLLLLLLINWQIKLLS